MKYDSSVAKDRRFLNSDLFMPSITSTLLYSKLVQILMVTLRGTPGFDLSFSSTVVKIYSFVTLLWVNKDENMEPNKFSQSIEQDLSHSY